MILLRLKPAHQPLSHGGFSWVLLQVPLCFRTCEPKQGCSLETQMSAANLLCQVNHELKVITLKYLK